MKKVIVTGGAGFIGSNLVKYLLKQKYFVINIDKLSYSANPYNLKNLSQNKARDWNPKVYPDNRKIVFMSDRDDNWEIYIMDFDGSNQINLSNNPRTDFSFSFLPLPN